MSEYAEDRVVDTILGAAVGILVSFVVIPRTNLAKTQAAGTWFSGIDDGGPP